MQTTKYFTKIFAAFILSLGLLTISPAVWAISTATTIDVGDSVTASGTNWTYTDEGGYGYFTVTGDVTITGSTGSATINRVIVAAGTTANITISDLDIDFGNGYISLSAIDMAGATVNLTIVGANRLVGGIPCPSIMVLTGGALTINGTDVDTLDVVGGGAGIGGEDAGSITINGGTISATGGVGAGIGGGYGSGGVITITGGHVTATGGYAGAGIGGAGGTGSNGAGGVITITGGTVDAYGGQYGAGIGGGGSGYGSTGSAGGTITITGGIVNATGGQYGAGIGGGGGGGGVGTNYNGGTGGAGGDIAISGSAQVTATAGESAAGIGGGAGQGAALSIIGFGVGGAGGNIVISDSAIVSASGNTYGAGIGGGGGIAGGGGWGGATGGGAGNILIYGESTQVTAQKGSYTSAVDIGAGVGISTLGDPGNVFVALTPANLTLSSSQANAVLFTADPASAAGVVTATLPAPLNAAPFGTGTIDVLTGGLGHDAATERTLSMITTFTTQTTTFSLAGFTPVTDTGTKIMLSGTSVNFIANSDIIIDLAEISVTAPALGATPDTLAAAIGDFTVSAVTWSPADPAFKFGTYTASVTLTPNGGYTFAGGLTIANINGKSATITDNGNGTVTLSYQFVLKQTNTTIPTLSPAMLALLALALMMAGAVTWRRKRR